MSMIAIVIGTNAELIKTLPIIKELDRRKKPYTFISTGQHDLAKICNIFNIRSPDVTLTKPPEKSSKFFVKTTRAVFWNLFIVPKIWYALRKIRNLKYVIYHGDTMSAASAAIASSRLLNPFKKYKNVHLEAGLRSGDLLQPFPEEISRIICDLFSDVLLAVSDGTEKNLKKWYIHGKIIKVGNTIIDSIYEALKIKPSIKIPREEYCVINSHRHENLKSKEKMEKIVSIIEGIGIRALWPMHDNTRKKLEDYGLMKKVASKKNLEITRLVSYVDFIHLLKNCKYIVTDGGSIQEESLELKKPCILIRNVTERDEGLVSGINFLTKFDIEYAKNLIKMVESDKLDTMGFKNPYGNKGVSKKVVDYLIRNQ